MVFIGAINPYKWPLVKRQTQDKVKTDVKGDTRLS